MRRLKFFVYVAILLIFAAIFSGCEKVVRKEYSVVEVTVIDSDYKSAYTTVETYGDNITVVSHDAQYKITVQYRNENKSYYTSGIYYQFCNKLGESAWAILETRIYENDSTKDILQEIYDTETKALSAIERRNQK